MDNQWSLDLLIIFVSSFIFKEAEPIKITSVEIPRIIKAGTEEPVILDCKYDMESTSNEALVVKWYVNQELLYQWIHGSEPKGSDEFRQFIDQTYKASTDPNTMYRAVKLVKPGHKLSGKVRCSISTQEAEVEAEKDMLVYSPEKVFRLSHPTLSRDSTQLTITCLAEDLFPFPSIKLFQDNQTIPGQREYHKNKTDGLHNIEAVVNLPADQIKIPTKFLCKIFIKDANYTAFREFVYNGGSLSHISFLLSLLIGLLIIKTTTTNK